MISLAQHRSTKASEVTSWTRVADSRLERNRDAAARYRLRLKGKLKPSGVMHIDEVKAVYAKRKVGRPIESVNNQGLARKREKSREEHQTQQVRRKQNLILPTGRPILIDETDRAKMRRNETHPKSWKKLRDSSRKAVSEALPSNAQRVDQSASHSTALGIPNVEGKEPPLYHIPFDHELEAYGRSVVPTPHSSSLPRSASDSRTAARGRQDSKKADSTREVALPSSPVHPAAISSPSSMFTRSWAISTIAHPHQQHNPPLSLC